MTEAWRVAGLTYVYYSFIAASLLRRALKPTPREEAKKRAYTSIVIRSWKDGKPGAKVNA